MSPVLPQTEPSHITEGEKFERIHYLINHPYEVMDIDISYPANFATLFYGGRITHLINEYHEYTVEGREIILGADFFGPDKNLISEYSIKGYKKSDRFFSRITGRKLASIEYNLPHSSLSTKSEIKIYERPLLEFIRLMVKDLNSTTGLNFKVR